MKKSHNREKNTKFSGDLKCFGCNDCGRRLLSGDDLKMVIMSDLDRGDFHVVLCKTTIGF